MNEVAVGSNPVTVTETSDIVPVSSKECLDIQATIECRFTLRRVREMIITQSFSLVIGKTLMNFTILLFIMINSSIESLKI